MIMKRRTIRQITINNPPTEGKRWVSTVYGVGKK